MGMAFGVKRGLSTSFEGTWTRWGKTMAVCRFAVGTAVTLPQRIGKKRTFLFATNIVFPSGKSKNSGCEQSEKTQLPAHAMPLSKLPEKT